MAEVAERFSALQDRARQTHESWERPPRPRIDIAIDGSSLAAGADQTRESLEMQARQSGADVDFGTIVGVGMQWLQPLVDICWPDGTRVLYGPINSDNVDTLLREATGNTNAASEFAIGTLSGSRTGIAPVSEHPFFAAEADRRLLARIGLTNPLSIEHYIATGGYAGMARMLDRDHSPETIRQLVTDSGLTGRGGAYFPAGVKWNFLAGASEVRRTVICNADEGDPGAWVNRVLLEGDPQAVIEGMLITAFATGSTHGYLYIRDEYPLAVERAQQAIVQAEAEGLLGKEILGSNFSCTIEVIRGAGAYVCGEETGLIASLQDERGMPRIKPPFPANPGGGVFGEASNVNNVETYASVPSILLHGPNWYKEHGTEDAAGTKLFSLSGDVQRVGFMELPWGTPLNSILNACGGMITGTTLKAIQAGGPLAGYLPGKLLDSLTMEPSSFVPHGALVGSGGVVFIGSGTCSIELNAAFADFLEDESCGRCTTCHGGNQRMTEIFRRMSDGGGRAEDRRSLDLIGEALQYSNCVHGSASPTVMRNTMRFFDAEYEAHVTDNTCESLRCRGLTRFRIIDQQDPALSDALSICPTRAIELVDDDNPDRTAPVRSPSSEYTYRIIDGSCIRCGACTDLAPHGIAREAAPTGTAIPIKSISGPPGTLQR